ncbi:hypothetical protein CMV_018177 [Castanea mollissima]|uniref:Uncharacterized protein n=1 Tax=Castanea mollissima TaxID=60419 RepID=A0A8J4VPV8_9ROSI|nr:hypothetical protein CMV_018177 [Castanea mollissima]
MISLIPTCANGLRGLPQTLQPPELPFMTSAAACSEPSLVSSNDYPYPRSLLCSLCWWGGASCGCDEEDFKTSIGFYSVILHTTLPEIRRVCKTWSPLVACIVRTNGYQHMWCHWCGQV